MTRPLGRLGAERIFLRPPTVLAVLAVLATRLSLRPPTVLTVLAVLATTTAPGAAHHVGTYVPKDNAVSANFKEIKFALQAGKLDVALRLFEGGALRREMRARAATLPQDLEAEALAAVRTGDARVAEGHLMVFFAALARDLAREAVRQLAEPGVPPETRAAIGPKFLEAIWRYYNLVDFAVSMRDSKSSVAMRLAFDEAETYAKTSAAPAAVNPCSGQRRAADRGRTAPDPDRLRASLERVAQILGDLVEASTPARRNP